jgi:hypothetical protein
MDVPPSAVPLPLVPGPFCQVALSQIRQNPGKTPNPEVRLKSFQTPRFVLRSV